MSDGKPTDTSRAPVSQRSLTIQAPGDLAEIGATISVTIDGQKTSRCRFGTTILGGREEGRTSRSRRSATTRTSASRESAASAWSRSRGSAHCKRRAHTPSPSPITVHTHTRKVRQARRHVLDLLLSNHYGECYACWRNKNCELQTLADEYGVDSFRFGHPDKPLCEMDTSSYSVIRDMNKCVLCRRCVRTCIDLQEVGVLEAVERGDKTRIATFKDKPLARRGLHQLRPVHQPLPHRGALAPTTPPTKSGPPSTTQRSTWSSRPRPRRGRPSPSASGFAPGTPLTFQLNTALQVLRLRQGLRHELHRRPHDHRRGHRAAQAPARGAR